MTFKVGDIITDGSEAGEIMERVERDPMWRTSGWRIRNIAMETFGGNANMTSFVPDYLSWRVITVGEWFPVIGGGLEQRYVWSSGHHHLRRELRKIGVDTSQS